MLHCWNLDPESRPTFEDLESKFGDILEADVAKVSWTHQEFLYGRNVTLCDFGSITSTLICSTLKWTPKPSGKGKPIIWLLLDNRRKLNHQIAKLTSAVTLHRFIFQWNQYNPQRWVRRIEYYRQRIIQSRPNTMMILNRAWRRTVTKPRTTIESLNSHQGTKFLNIFTFNTEIVVCLSSCEAFTFFLDQSIQLWQCKARGKLQCQMVRLQVFEIWSNGGQISKQNGKQMTGKWRSNCCQIRFNGCRFPANGGQINIQHLIKWQASGGPMTD